MPGAGLHIPHGLSCVILMATLSSRNSFFFFNLLFWLHCVFAAELGLSPVVVSKDDSSSQCSGFLSQWLLLLQSTGSRVHGLQQLWHTGSGVLAYRL